MAETLRRLCAWPLDPHEGGFFHDGRFATLNDGVQHYNSFFGLGLNDKQAHDLVEYLKSL
jgi:cytochrome c peroxidase